MRLCIFNPEHDLCLAKGRAHYVPPRSAVEFARRDADIMAVLCHDCCLLVRYKPFYAICVQRYEKNTEYANFPAKKNHLLLYFPAQKMKPHKHASVTTPAIR